MSVLVPSPPEVESATTAGDVCAFVEPVTPDTRCEVVAERLTADPDLYALPVVAADGLPVGLLNRFRLVERLSHRFGRDLLLRRAVVETLEVPPLILDRATPIEQVGTRLFADDRNHIL